MKKAPLPAPWLRKVGRFELAHGSTIFLDEIGELPLGLQAKLLRVLQSGEFERLGSSKTLKAEVRVIAATNRNLEDEVRQGRFREDLWYRLNVFPITVPPLRQRREDIPLLVQAFVARFAKRVGKEITKIPAATMESLCQYQWPGNIRELENVIERAVINTSGAVLTLAARLDPSQAFPPRDLHGRPWKKWNGVISYKSSKRPEAGSPGARELPPSWVSIPVP